MTSSVGNVYEKCIAMSKADSIFDAVWENTFGLRITLEWDIALAFIERIGEYNDFDSKKVLQALQYIDEIIPRMKYGDGNPNNGLRDFKISVGREYSPVIYIERFELYRSDFPKNPLTGEMVKRICGIMTDVALADESDCEIIDNQDLGMGKSFEFRFWWD